MPPHTHSPPHSPSLSISYTMAKTLPKLAFSSLLFFSIFLFLNLEAQPPPLLLPQYRQQVKSHRNSSSASAAKTNLSATLFGAMVMIDDPLTVRSDLSSKIVGRVQGIECVPWTEEEHRLFLIGLQKLGKGDWRGIARNFVMSRTPTQVASHAQKYFIRQSNATRRKRRSSLFDMAPDMAMDPPPVPEEQFLLPPCQARELDNANSLPSLNLSLNQEVEPMEATSQETDKEAEETVVLSSNFPPMVPAFYPGYPPVPFQFWPANVAPLEQEKGAETSHHQVLKPIPIHCKESVNVDELVGMSQLSLGETENGHTQPSPLSLKLIGAPSRQSAFHASAPVSGSDLSEGKSSAIQAV